MLRIAPVAVDEPMLSMKVAPLALVFAQRKHGSQTSANRRLVVSLSNLLGDANGNAWQVAHEPPVTHEA